MHYCAEAVGSFENLVQFGERSRDKVFRTTIPQFGQIRTAERYLRDRGVRNMSQDEILKALAHAVARPRTE